MKKISFVILTWNSDKYITNCIESINTICNFWRFSLKKPLVLPVVGKKL